MNYEQLKNFGKEHKPQIITVIACGVMFVVGFGTGRAGKPVGQEPKQLQDNYTVKSKAKPEAGETKDASPVTDDAQTDAAASPTTKTTKATSPGNDYVPGQPCLIKGNISGSNRIYHIKGGASYEKTTPEKCFSTEAEAVVAGFRKAKR